ncbi:MAG: tyrosine-type recombinase/integrase [Pseudonocardiaceae bacterium]
MGHVQDTWYRTVIDAATGKHTREKTGLHGKGQRYRVRYLDPEGAERSKSFPDRQKKAADDFLVSTENDKRRGTYIDPNAGSQSFRAYAEAWLESQTFEESTREAVALRLRKHILPHLGRHTLAALSPTHIRTWDREMQKLGLAPSYRQVMFIHVQTILNAAVDDEKIRKNPCSASSVRKPQIPPRKVKPWPLEWVHAVHDALADRYRITVPLGAGVGLRQGELFGLAVDDVDFLGKTVHVVRQVKIVGQRPCFGPPKRGKTRDVPLPDSVGLALAQHIERYPPVAVTLPWQEPGGELVTARLIVYSRERTAAWRPVFNQWTWKPALSRADVPSARENGVHALRHFYASTLLDAGETITALAAYLGHSDPAFTLRVYTHLMPSSEERTRRAVDGVFGPASPSADDMATA